MSGNPIKFFRDKFPDIAEDTIRNVLDEEIANAPNIRLSGALLALDPKCHHLEKLYQATRRAMERLRAMQLGVNQ